MSWVPALGLPKITNVVGGIVKPTAIASALWSIDANTLRPWLANADNKRCTVSAKGYALRILTMPLEANGVTGMLSTEDAYALRASCSCA